MLRLLLFSSLLALLGGCLNGTPPPQAPTDLEGNLKWFWANSKSASDDDLVDAALKMNTVMHAQTRDKAKPNRGQLASLSADQLAVAGLEMTNDPSTARGFFLVNVFDCTLDKLEPLLFGADQKALRPDSYTTYSREFTTDLDAYTTRTKPLLEWNVNLGVALPFPISENYSSNLGGGLHRVTPAEGKTPFGPFLVQHTWLKTPATFDAPSTSTFTQDYQIEVYWERTPGEIFHGYAIWREMKLTALGLGTNDDGYINIVLDNLKSWDDTTSTLCKK